MKGSLKQENYRTTSIESSIEVEEVRVYRGDILTSKLVEYVENSKKRIIAVLSHIPEDIKEILERAKCKLIVASSNAKVVKNAEAYEFIGRYHAETCHGILVFDDSVVMMLFRNGLNLGIVGDGEGLVSLYTMLVNFFLEKARSEELS